MEITIAEMIKHIKEVDKANGFSLINEYYSKMPIAKIIKIYDEYYGLEDISKIVL